MRLSRSHAPAEAGPSRFAASQEPKISSFFPLFPFSFQFCLNFFLLLDQSVKNQQLSVALSLSRSLSRFGLSDHEPPNLTQSANLTSLSPQSLNQPFWHAPVLNRSILLLDPLHILPFSILSLIPPHSRPSVLLSPPPSPLPSHPPALSTLALPDPITASIVSENDLLSYHNLLDRIHRCNHTPADFQPFTHLFPSLTANTQHLNLA